MSSARPALGQGTLLERVSRSLAPTPAALLAIALAYGATTPAGAQSAARLPNLRGAPAGDVVVPVTIAPADGITELALAFAYDPEILTPTGAYTTGFTAGYTVHPSLHPPDEIRLVLSGPVLQGTGEVAWVTFDVDASAGAFSGLVWRGCLLNDGLVPCETQDGRVDVASREVTVHVPDDGHGEPGTTAVVPIDATSFDNAESIDLTLQYRPETLAAVSVSKTALTSPLTLTSNVTEPGIVRISFFGTTPISGSGTLAEVTFDVVGPLSDRTPLDLAKALFNEGAPSTVADDGSFLVCSEADGDGDLQSSCEGDCNDADPLVLAGAVEICDGVDNDCDGWIDNADVPAERPSLALAKQDASAVLSWPAVSLATGYDVTRGGIDALRSSGGDFASATATCLADDQPETSFHDADPAPVGDGFWYLVRAVNCGGAGTYDNGTAGQHPGRDDGIAAATESCP